MKSKKISIPQAKKMANNFRNEMKKRKEEYYIKESESNTVYIPLVTFDNYQPIIINISKTKTDAINSVIDFLNQIYKQNGYDDIKLTREFNPKSIKERFETDISSHYCNNYYDIEKNHNISYTLYIYEKEYTE